MTQTTRVQKPRRFRRGLTLLEVLLIIVILGYLASLVNPRVLNLASWTNSSEAVARARILNMAMNNYYSAVSNAQTNWTTAGTSSAQYLLLYNAGLLPQQPSTFATFCPTTGYTLTLPASLTSQVTVKDPSNNVVTYQ